jgi:hypothetical protein
MRISKVGWLVMTVLGLVIAAMAARYFTFDPNVFFAQQRAVYSAHELALGVHIAGATVAIVSGPWQFVDTLRRRLPRLHRCLGVTYLAGCLVAGVGGLLLAPTSYGGPAAGLGFAMLAVCWLATGGIGLRMILAGRVADHRRWMIRSFALTFAAVTLRAIVAVSQLAGWDFTVSYVAAAWLCWLPNLALAWWFTRVPARPAVAPAAATEPAPLRR